MTPKKTNDFKPYTLNDTKIPQSIWCQNLSTQSLVI